GIDSRTRVPLTRPVNDAATTRKRCTTGQATAPSDKPAAGCPTRSPTERCREPPAPAATGWIVGDSCDHEKEDHHCDRGLSGNRCRGSEPFPRSRPQCGG